MTTVVDPPKADAHLEQIAAKEPAAARILCVSYKTLAGLPAEKTGRFKIGRSVLYHLPTLRKFAAELVGKSIEVTA